MQQIKIYNELNKKICLIAFKFRAIIFRLDVY